MKKNNTIHTTIDGLNITVTTHNIHIEDSYTVTKRIKMRAILDTLEKYIHDSSITMVTPFNNRSINSMVSEWVTHNNLYKLNIEPERTKNCDLNYPQKWYMPIIYFFGGLIVL